MATLNIKNLPDALHRRLCDRARHQRRSLSQEATQILADALDAGERSRFCRSGGSERSDGPASPPQSMWPRSGADGTESRGRPWPRSGSRADGVFPLGS